MAPSQTTGSPYAALGLADYRAFFGGKTTGDLKGSEALAHDLDLLLTVHWGRLPQSQRCFVTRVSRKHRDTPAADFGLTREDWNRWKGVCSFVVSGHRAHRAFFTDLEEHARRLAYMAARWPAWTDELAKQREDDSDNGSPSPTPWIRTFPQIERKP